MVVPVRRARKLVVRSPGTESSLRNRTPQEIVQAVNIATDGSDAIAARTMLNDNVIITFWTDANTKTQNAGWITKAFGNNTSISGRELAVLAKGLSAKKLRDTYDKAGLAKVFR
jgi:hypothetical protein